MNAESADGRPPFHALSSWSPKSFALAGYDVELHDVSEAAMEKAMETIAGHMERQVSRGRLTPEARDAALISQVKTDPHSPSEFRVNGSLRNHPGFYEAFDVKPGDKMYLAPKDRVIMW